jgi:hypothetical protein
MTEARRVGEILVVTPSLNLITPYQSEREREDILLKYADVMMFIHMCTA